MALLSPAGHAHASSSTPHTIHNILQRRSSPSRRATDSCGSIRTHAQPPRPSRLALSSSRPHDRKRLPRLPRSHRRAHVHASPSASAQRDCESVAICLLGPSYVFPRMAWVCALETVACWEIGVLRGGNQCELRRTGLGLEDLGTVATNPPCRARCATGAASLRITYVGSHGHPEMRLAAGYYGRVYHRVWSLDNTQSRMGLLNHALLVGRAPIFRCLCTIARYGVHLLRAICRTTHPARDGMPILRTVHWLDPAHGSWLTEALPHDS